MLDVAIIGAGPAGLTTAAALLQSFGPQAKVQVFDHVPKLGVCGAGLALLTNGLSALEAISPELLERIRNAGIINGSVYSHSAAGKTVMPAPGLKQPLLGWSELQHELAKWLPPGVLQLSKRFAQLEQCEDHVVVHFADGSSITTRVLVGADGCFSKVRQQTMADGPPEFTVGFRLLCIAQWNEAALTAADAPPKPAKISTDAFAKPSTVSSKAPAKSANDAAGGTADSLTQQQAEAGNITVQRCKAVYNDKVDVITAAIDATDPATALEHKLYVRHPNSLERGHWGVGRVTLVGDAAHPLRPTGQGVNQGFEDAVELGYFLSQGGLLPDSLRKFEASRIPRVQQIMACEMMRGMKAYGMTDEVKQEIQTLLHYKWAKAIWEAKVPEPRGPDPRELDPKEPEPREPDPKKPDPKEPEPKEPEIGAQAAYAKWVLDRSFPLAA